MFAEIKIKSMRWRIYTIEEEGNEREVEEKERSEGGEETEIPRKKVKEKMLRKVYREK